MRQITSGETPKIKIYDRSHVEDFIQTIRQDFDRVIDDENCLYDNSFKVINNPVLNFLNIFDAKFKGEDIKALIKKEFDDCEKIYPYLGDLFVMKFFNTKCIENNNFLLQNSSKSRFLKTIKNKEIRNICKEIFETASLERTINIKPSHIKESTIEKVNDIVFRINYDTDFLGSKEEIELKNYRYLIIDGFIESIGEIYHLLHFAAKSKEPYLIFCYGMSSEVKNVILQNNAKEITQIIPISMQLDESTVNILNDLALIHDCDIVSSLKGQTISQETRKELPVGKKAIVKRNSIFFTPVCDKLKIISHVNFLNKRIDEAEKDTNTDVIRDRIKNLSSKSINLYIPESLSKTHEFARELDYAIRFLSNCEKNMSTFNISKNWKVFIPEMFVRYTDKKVNSLKDVFYNIEKLILFEEK